jgi:hypothetical protein
MKTKLCWMMTVPVPVYLTGNQFDPTKKKAQCIRQDYIVINEF